MCPGTWLSHIIPSFPLQLLDWHLFLLAMMVSRLMPSSSGSTCTQDLATSVRYLVLSISFCSLLSSVIINSPSIDKVRSWPNKSISATNATLCHLLVAIRCQDYLLVSFCGKATKILLLYSGKFSRGSILADRQSSSIARFLHACTNMLILFCGSVVNCENWTPWDFPLYSHHHGLPNYWLYLLHTCNITCQEYLSIVQNRDSESNWVGQLE